MHKTYKELYERLKSEGNRRFASDPERSEAMLDMIENTLYHLLGKLAAEEARYQVEMD